MKIIIKIVLTFMFMFWLTGCVFVWNQNFGSDIHTTKRVDDFGIGQHYQAEIKDNKRK